MRQYLTRILTSSILIVFTLLLGVFFYGKAENVDLAWSKSQQIHSSQIDSPLSSSDITDPTIWLGTNTTRLDFPVDREQLDTPVQFDLTESKQTSTHQITCSVEHLTPSIQIPTDISTPSLPLEYLSDWLVSAVDKQYFVYLQSPLGDIENYNLVIASEEYSKSSIHPLVDCGEQTLVVPATLVTHISTFSSRYDTQVQ